MAITAVSVAYVLTTIGRATTVSGEYVTTSILFVGAALVTGTIIPWGLWAQAFTVGIAATSLLAAVWYRDRSFAIAAPDAAVAVVVGLSLSLVAAREITNYRLAHRRELIDRKRAERAVRRLAARLEQRVLERTVALERAHEELHRHQAELAHVLRLHTIGEMASALAHEINQPLCAITNYAQGAVQRLRTAPPTSTACARPARRSPTRASAPARSCAASAPSCGGSRRSVATSTSTPSPPTPSASSIRRRASMASRSASRAAPTSPACRPTAPRSSR